MNVFKFSFLAAMMMVAACGPLADLLPPSDGVEEEALQETVQDAPATAPSVRLADGPDEDDLFMRPAPDIAALLGAPDLARGETWAKLWRYHTQNCTLLVYFYPDPAGGDVWRAAYVEARRPGGGGAALDPCIAAVAGRRAAG